MGDPAARILLKQSPNGEFDVVIGTSTLAISGGRRDLLQQAI